MATVDRYKIKIEVDGKEKIIDAEQALNNFATKLSNTAKIGVGALTALTVSAARMADQMVDLAGTAGMSAGKIFQMSAAAQAAGGDFDQVSGMLLKFSSSVQSAVDGSSKLITSFEKVGVSRQDLEMLSDEQLFQAVVSGLGNMADGAEKTALSIELLGKRAATTNLKQFAEDINQAVDPRIEQTLQNAAKAVDTVEKAFRDLQMAALQVFGPILEVVGNFETSIDGAVQALRVLTSMLAAAFAASTVVAIGRMVTIVRTLAATLSAAAAAATTLVAVTGVGLAMAGAAVAAGLGTYYALGRAIDEAAEAQENFNNAVGDSFVGPTQPVVSGPVRTLNLDANERAVILAKQTTEQMRKQNELAIGLRSTILEVSNIERNRAQQRIADNQALNEFKLAEQRIKDEIALEEAKGTEANQEVINQLNLRLGLAQELYDSTLDLNNAEFNRLNTIRLQNEALKDQLSVINQAYSGVEETQRINMIMAQAVGMITTEREKYLKTQTEELRNTRTLNELTLQLNAAITNGTDDQIAGLERLIREENTRHTTAMNNIEAEQIANDMLNNSRVAGAVSALEQIQAQFTPFKMAQDAILSTFNNIGSAIDQVAKGGKASFRDMAASIIGDLGAMISKALVFRAIGGALGMAGVTSIGGASVSALFGGARAQGGPVSPGMSYLVGERGPEMFVPRSAGNIVPDSGGGVTNVTYNIQAVDARSFRDLVAADPEFIHNVARRGARRYS